MCPRRYRGHNDTSQFLSTLVISDFGNAFIRDPANSTEVFSIIGVQPSPERYLLAETSGSELEICRVLKTLRGRREFPRHRPYLSLLPASGRWSTESQSTWLLRTGSSRRLPGSMRQAFPERHGFHPRWGRLRSRRGDDC